MKRIAIFIITILCCGLVLSGCGECKHEWLTPTGAACGVTWEKVCKKCNETVGDPAPHTWEEATCEKPKTCSACGLIEGEALGHEWQAATCEKPKTCSTCGLGEGEALGHEWQAATCEKPKTCSTCALVEGAALDHEWKAATCEKPKTCIAPGCGKTEGEALGHAWQEATTEAPKTCSGCGKTEGERIVTDPRFSTADSKVLFGTWEGNYTMTGEMMGDPTLPGMELILGITFNNDGTYTEYSRMADKEGYLQEMTDYYVDALYTEFEISYGFTKEQADAAMKETYGMDVLQYSQVAASTIDWDAMLEASSQSGVYYVKDHVLYSGESWDAEMAGDPFTISGDTMIVDKMINDATDMTLKKVMEGASGQAPEEKQEESEKLIMTVTASSLTIRSGPGTQYDAVGYLSGGTQVEVLEQQAVEDRTWARISRGWVSMKYLK